MRLDKILFISFILSLNPFSQHAYGQTEYMINGGFEQWDNNASDFYAHSIEYALGWHNLLNTCDVIHPMHGMISGTPLNGDACGRFGVPSNGLSEFCYGTTTPLTAGEKYQVSFWIRKDYSTNVNLQIGLVISPTLPTIQLSPYSTSHQPFVTVTPTTTQYVQVSKCFTAQTNGTHYVTIGPFGGVIPSTAILFLIDDVSVMSVDPNSQLPIAGLTIPQTTYCVGDAITVDGSSTVDENGYIWEIYRMNQGNEIFRYNSGQQNGQAGTFNVSSVIGAVNPGECYRVYLTAIGDCDDRTYIDFCYADPRVDIVHEGSAVCENTPVELTATGDNGWTYNWSNGQSGVGLKTITVTPTVGNSNYSVTVTTSEGCTHTETVSLTVHTYDNLAPWMDGINGSGHYTIYVNQGDAVNFTSTLYNDNPSEVIDIEFETNVPSSGLNFSLPGTGGGTFSFNWQTSLATPMGEYYYTLIADDRNACVPLVGTFTFKIVVICDYCPICLYYEDRTPNHNPLPGQTKVGDCIYAGITETVETGNADVLFQAGNTIVLGDYFSAGPGFEAQIDPQTCVTDCEACCKGFHGFTLDLPLPNAITPNDDGVNDVWFVNDIDNPFCAFNAQGFSLFIFNRWGNIVHKMEDYGGGCCSYEAPSPSNDIPHSSIYWDGTDYLTGNLVTSNANYFYVLTLFGCGQESQYHGFMYLNYTVIYGLAPQDDSYLLDAQAAELFATDGVSDIEELVMQSDESTITLSPNPASDIVTINGLQEREYTVVLLSGKGNKVMQKKVSPMDRQINVSQLASGTYFVLITGENNVHFDKLVVN